jgi:hypothetical protein
MVKQRARLVAHCFVQQPIIDCEEVIVLVTRMESVRLLLLALDAQEGSQNSFLQ